MWQWIVEWVRYNDLFVLSLGLYIEHIQDNMYVLFDKQRNNMLVLEVFFYQWVDH